MANEKWIGRKWLGNFAKWGICPGDKRGLCCQKNVFPVLVKPQVAKGKILEGPKWKCFPSNP